MLYTFYDGNLNVALNEQLASEIVQALIAQAAASGLTINDYLACLD